MLDGVTVVPKRVQLRGAMADAADDSEDNSSRASSSSSKASSSSRASSSSKGGERCVLQLDVSEGKKHEVRLAVLAVAVAA